MAIDLSTLTRKELEKLKSDADQALAKLDVEERKAALAAAQKAAADFGYSLAELTGGATAKRSKTSAAPKYKNPDDATKTWTGKGRQPDWFKAAIANGVSPDDMEI